MMIRNSRWCGMSSLALLGGAVLSSPVAAESDSIQQHLDDLQSFQVIAHRGASGHAPEATWSAFEQAEAMNADYLEMDVQMTADGELVVFHDETVDRSTDGEGKLKDFTLEELKALDAGSWFNETFPDYADDDYAGAQILTLDEVIERFGTDERYYLETKSPELYPELEEALVEALEGHGLVESGSVIIQSFSDESLKTVHELNADIPLVQLVWYYPEDEGSDTLVEWTDVTPGPGEIADADFQAIGEYAVGVGTNMTYGEEERQVIDADFVEQAQANDLLVHVYTINDEETMQTLLDWGVDGIFTNFPDRLNELVE